MRRGRNGRKRRRKRCRRERSVNGRKGTGKRQKKGIIRGGKRRWEEAKKGVSKDAEGKGSVKGREGHKEG